MKEVIFYDWVFLVDFEKTVEAYSNVPTGGSTNCECGICRNFLRHQNNIYPQEILNLFQKIGIDYKKDEDVVSNYRNEVGLLQMMLFFDFYGEIKTTGSKRIKITNNFDFFESDTGHSILFQEGKGVVKLYFETFVEWALDEAYD